MSDKRNPNDHISDAEADMLSFDKSRPGNKQSAPKKPRKKPSMETPADIDPADDPDFKSKSQLKREMHELQKIAAALIDMKPGQIAEISMSDSLRAAIEESWRITQNEAKRRHMQYLGKLMRHEDLEQLQRGIDGFNSGSVENTRRLHIAERWRERMINDDSGITEFIAAYPAAEAQHLRNLVRNSRKDISLQRNTGQTRKLFRYLRELVDQGETPDY